MVFSSITFLYFFLPILLIVYYIVPKKMQWIVLFFANIYFYLCACTSLWHMIFIMAASVITYIGALIIEGIEKERHIYKYDEIVGLKYKLLLNTDYYQKQNGIRTELHLSFTTI